METLPLPIVKLLKQLNWLQHSFISTLPQGYNTQLENDGSNLSQDKDNF